MRESYPSTADRSSPAVPELPEAPPQKFQFSLKHLLAFMLACAVIAAVLRYIVQFLRSLPDHQLAGWVNSVVAGLAFGALFYFFFRAPFLGLQMNRLRRRWITVRAHRRALERWTRERIEQRSKQNPSEGTTPLESTTD
jgi:hypothetical protein